MAKYYNRKISKAIKKFAPSIFRKILPDKEVQDIAAKHNGDIRHRKGYLRCDAPVSSIIVIMKNHLKKFGILLEKMVLCGRFACETKGVLP